MSHTVAVQSAWDWGSPECPGFHLPRIRWPHRRYKLGSCLWTDEHEKCGVAWMAESCMSYGQRNYRCIDWGEKCREHIWWQNCIEKEVGVHGVPCQLSLLPLDQCVSGREKASCIPLPVSPLPNLRMIKLYLRRWAPGSTDYQVTVRWPIGEHSRMGKGFQHPTHTSPATLFDGCLSHSAHGPSSLWEQGWRWCFSEPCVQASFLNLTFNFTTASFIGLGVSLLFPVTPWIKHNGLFAEIETFKGISKGFQGLRKQGCQDWDSLPNFTHDLSWPRSITGVR